MATPYSRIVTFQRPPRKCNHCDKAARPSHQTKLGFIVWSNTCVDHAPRKQHIYKKHKKDKCELCDFIPINKCQLQVDHIDGNHNNNNLNNLQTLCANCHILKTFLNKEGIYKNHNIIKE